MLCRISDGHVHFRLHGLLDPLDLHQSAVADGGQPLAFGSGGAFGPFGQALEEAVVHELPGQRRERGDPVEGRRGGDEGHERVEIDLGSQRPQIPRGDLKFLFLGLGALAGGGILQDGFAGVNGLFRKRRVLLGRRRAGDGVQEREHIRVDPAVLLGDERGAGGRIGIDQVFHQFRFRALLLKHLARDPVRLQNPFHHPLERQRRLRTQEISFAQLGGQRLHHLLDQSAEHLFLFHRGSGADSGGM